MSIFGNQSPESGSEQLDSQVKSNEVKVDHDKLVESAYPVELEQNTTNDAVAAVPPIVKDAGSEVHSRANNVVTREDEILRLPEEHFATLRQSVIDLHETLGQVEAKTGIRVVLRSQEFPVDQASKADVIAFLASIQPVSFEQDDRRQA